jgi:hypothetical protein
MGNDLNTLLHAMFQVRYENDIIEMFTVTLPDMYSVGINELPEEIIAAMREIIFAFGIEFEGLKDEE